MTVAETVREYYATLRAGDPLPPYFREAPTTVKYGISEALVGYEEVAAGLRAQTGTTTDWEVDSHDLTADGTDAGDGDACGWFADDVSMAWTDTERRVRFEFETRWSGTVVDGEFAAMHVSTAEAF